MSIEWEGAAVSPDDGVPAPSEWVPVTVPGRPSRFADADAVAYRTRFDDPREGDDEHATLALHGTYAHARVWHDGEELASHDAYFERLRLPLDVAADNEVVVECRRPDDRFGGSYETDGVPAEDAVPGIWWEAAIETHPDPAIEALDVTPTVVDGEARVRVAATVSTRSPLDDRITLSIRPAGETRGGGTMDRLPVDVPSGRSTVTETVTMRDADLWWPHDVGGQPRYAIRAKLGDATRTVETGFRTVTYDRAEGLEVNGQRVPARGVNVLDARPEDVDLAVDANANLLRAHAHAVSPAVLEACDERGVLLWEDLPLTGPGEFDEGRATDLVERLVDSSRSHPAVAALGIHDDPVESFAAGLGNGFLDRLRFRWRAWRAGYDDETADAVAAVIEDVPTFPVVGRPGIEPDAATLYVGREFGDPASLEWLCDRYDLGDVVAEFGTVAGEGDGAGRAETVGRIAERLRLRGSNVLAAYTLRDASGDAVELLAADGSPSGAFDRVRTAYRPLQTVLTDPTPGDSEVVVVHDSSEAASVTVEWDVGGEREQTTLDVGAYGRETAGTVTLSDGDAVTLAVARDGSVSHNEYRI